MKMVRHWRLVAAWAGSVMLFGCASQVAREAKTARERVGEADTIHLTAHERVYPQNLFSFLEHKDIIAFGLEMAGGSEQWYQKWFRCTLMVDNVRRDVRPVGGYGETGPHFLTVIVEHAAAQLTINFTVGAGGGMWTAVVEDESLQDTVLQALWVNPSTEIERGGTARVFAVGLSRQPGERLRNWERVEELDLLAEKYDVVAVFSVTAPAQPRRP
jgi:hypothetical protein